MDQSASITTQIIQNIVDQCMNHGIQISTGLAALTIRTTMLTVDDTLPLDFADIIKRTVSSLVAAGPRQQMQRVWTVVMARCQQDRERAEEAKHAHREECQSLCDEISTFSGKGQAAMDVLYRKIITYMIVSSKLGTATDFATLTATQGVLGLMFPRTELQPFLQAERAERAFQVQELAVVVAGIRLLDHAQGKPSSFSDIPKQALEMVRSLVQGVTSEAAYQRERIHKYAAVLATRHDDRLVDESNFHHQFLAFVTFILEDVVELKDRITELRGLYNESITGLAQATSADSSKSLPPEKIYPMFMTLAKIWQQVDKEKSQLEARSNLFKCLLGLKNTFTPTLNEDEASQAAATYTPDTISASNSMRLQADFNEKETAIIDSKNIDSQSALELKGFCPWTLVENDGLLMQGDCSNVVVRYQGKYYACTNSRALEEFASDPTKYINGIVSLVRTKPELIFLLELQQLFPSLQSFGASMPLKGKSSQSPKKSTTEADPRKKDSETQTDTHPVPSYIDRNYCWNEWELRRNAIKLVELRYKATHSTQTNGSHFRRENSTQHYAPKENATQSGISTGTSPKITKNYVTGLRGKPTQKAKVVKLELDL